MSGRDHGFHNNATQRDDEAAAERAWSRTIDLVKRRLV
ncbi:MAG: dienelactone hydrolase family protein [Pseudomonadota bacterium]